MNAVAGTRGPGSTGAAPRVARHRVVALGLQFLHLGGFASTLDAGFDPGALAASGVASALLYSGFLAAEYRWNGYRVTPILFYLAAGVFRLGGGVLFVAAAASDWRLLRVGVHDVSPYLMHGHWLALVGDWCFVLGYVAVTSMSSRHFAGPASVAPGLWRQVWRAGLLTAATAFLLRIAARYTGFGGFDSLVGYAQDYGIAAGVYLMLLACRRGGGGLLAPGAVVAWVALALDVADGFFSYMKADLLVAVLPIVLVGFDRARGGPSRASPMSRFAPPIAAGVLIVYFFLFVVSTYSSTRRLDFRDYGEGADPYSVPVAPYLTEALLAGIPGTADFRDAHRFPNGVWGLIGRMSMTPYPAWAYRQVESAGFRGVGFFEELLTNVTPRVFWPDKPLISPGRDFSVTIGAAANFDSARSATALTLQGAYYWRGGYVWLVLGCALSGAAFAVSWLLFRNQSVLNPASAVVTILLCHEGFRWFESAFVGGFPQYIYLLVVFLPAQVVLRLAMGYRASRRPGGSEA